MPLMKIVQAMEIDPLQSMQIQEKPKESMYTKAMDKLLTAMSNVGVTPEKLEETKAVLRDANLSDAGNADRFLAIFSKNFFVSNDDWFVWDGNRWKKIKESQLYPVLIKILRLSRQFWDLSESIRETKKGQDTINSLINAENEPRLKATLNIAGSQSIREHETLDTNNWLLNTPSCTLDLHMNDTGGYDGGYDARRSDYITHITRASYNTEADTTTWEKFVSDVFPDLDTRRWIQKFLGYGLTGFTNEHKILILHGKGRNGKSTFINAIAYALGDYACTIDPSVLLTQHSYYDGRPTPYLAALHSKRLVIASETQRGRSLNDATIKNITSDDKITARNLHCNPIEFYPNHKIILMTNYTPIVQNIDDPALRARIVIVSCDAKFQKLDRQLPEKLRTSENLSAILNWLLIGCQNWQTEGLDPLPNEINNTLDSYYTQNDELGQFITECCKIGNDEIIKLTDFVKDYNTWREDNGYRKVTSKVVKESLESRGFQYKSICNKKTNCKTIRAVIGLSTFSRSSEAEKEKAESLFIE